MIEGKVEVTQPDLTLERIMQVATGAWATSVPGRKGDLDPENWRELGSVLLDGKMVGFGDGSSDAD